MNCSFFAYLSRMKEISRWALMHNSVPENVQEHSHMTAVIAHALAVIRRDVFGRDADPDAAAAAALFHDASEILTGDLPTPIKYYSSEIKDAYKQVERIAGNRLLEMLPQELRASYEHLVLEDDKEIEPLVKAADKLSAHIKCLEEQKAGNTDFDSAAKQTWDAMKAMARPELDWFLDNCLSAFSLNLDQLRLDGAKKVC